LPEVVVKGDFNRLSQVLTNLISNAVKHSPTDGVVGVAAELQGGLARVSVIDRGSGVPHKFRDKIFRRFSQADASDTRGSGGAGLGLAICKSIIEQHDGAIGFVSEPDKRTEFHFTLQLWDPAKAAPASIAGV
jgi:signal transduction histidine kinase